MTRVKIADITGAACRLTFMSKGDLTSPRRVQYIMRVRQAVYFIARQHGYSYRTIGGALGGRDHSTVVRGCEIAEIMIERKPVYRSLVWEIAHIAARDAKRREEDASRVASKMRLAA